MFAILNKKTKKWVYGTDYRYSPSRQRTSLHQALTFDSYDAALIAFKSRRCGKSYVIVEVKLMEVTDDSIE